MLDSVEVITELLKRDSLEERADVTNKMLKDESFGFLSSVRDLIDRELKAITLDAQKEADVFWATSEYAREMGEEASYVGTRIRVQGNSIQCEWYRNRTRPDLGPGKPKRVFSSHIKKGTGLRYKSELFQGEPEWLREAVERAEDKFVNVRLRAKALVDLRRSLKSYEALLGKAFD